MLNPELSKRNREITRIPFDIGNVTGIVESGLFQEKLDLQNRIANPEGYHGSFFVDQFVSFGNSFEPLKGEYNPSVFGEWNIPNLKDEGIFVAEYESLEAKNIVSGISTLAQQLIENPALYDDRAVTEKYYTLARAGYDLLNTMYGTRQLKDSIILSLERGGLPSTRLGLGLGKDSVMDNEIRVMTKRCHPIDNPSHMSVAVDWREPKKLALMSGADVAIFDFVNPASGASSLAALLCAIKKGFKPKSVTHIAVSATKQGIRFSQYLRKLGIEPEFITLGICNRLNGAHYLDEPGKVVGDAGHALRHYLPSWYKQ